MVHSFDIKDAQQYGVHEAVLLYNIRFWIEKNRANEKNFYEGSYWTYNSTKAFQQLFPYLSEYQIQRCLKKLEECGVLKTGNFNSAPYDRTKWYTITEKCNTRLRGNDFANLQNGVSNNAECISQEPETNTISKPYRKPNQNTNNTAIDSKEWFSTVPTEGLDAFSWHHFTRNYNAAKGRRTRWEDVFLAGERFRDLQMAEGAEKKIYKEWCKHFQNWLKFQDLPNAKRVSL